MKKGPATRAAILREAFQLSYARGYRLTSIDDILRSLGLSKGAFYHHFGNKEEMGAALISELIAPRMEQLYRSLLTAAADPLQAIHHMMKRLLFEEPELLAAHGCPVGNLVQDTDPKDAHMREALEQVMQVWQQSLEKLLRDAVRHGIIQKNLKPAALAAFLISGYWGVRTLGKIGDSGTVYKAYLQELGRYLEGLRAAKA